jgi:hypothetical protein
MSGAIEERMAEAVERASVIVMFVSMDYKERPNCRMEAQYAAQRVRNGFNLQFMYLMMNKDYTTVSKPVNFGGWLF